MEFLFNSTASSMLTSSSPKCVCEGETRGSCYYDTYDLSVSTAGIYAIFSDSAIDTFGYLYNASFMPHWPQQNLIIANDNDGPNGQFRLEVYLEPNVKYTIVVTTYIEWLTGWYTIVVSGPAAVNLIQTTNIGTTPIPVSINTDIRK